MAGSTKYNYQIVPTGTPAQVGPTGQRRLVGVSLFGGSGASSVQFKNAATDTGDVLFSMNALTADNKFVDLSALGGVSFSTAIYCKPAGTGAIVHVWYE